MDNPETKPTHVESGLKQRIVSLYASMARRLGIQQPPKITLTQNAKNAEEPFGLTAYYNQQDRSIRVHITKRHPTDILRSFAHELIHHWQNEHGALPAEQKGGHAHYAQKNPVLRKREMEAYLLGNILFRDWQDENRYGPLNENLAIDNSHTLKIAIKNMLFDMIRQNVIKSYHRDATSGDMKPEDFVEDMAKKIELALEQMIQTINDRGNWENQGNMISEMISRRQLKTFVKERIEKIMEVDFFKWREEQDRLALEKWNKEHPNYHADSIGEMYDMKDELAADQAAAEEEEDANSYLLRQYSKKDKKKNKKNRKSRGQQGFDLPQDRNLNYAKWLQQAFTHQKKLNKKAEKYYDIGFTPSLQGENHYCWYWNANTNSIVTAKGGSHQSNFGKEIPYMSFRGRYDMKTKELSVAIPEFGAMKKPTGDLKKDAPPGMIDALNKTFHNPKIFYFPFIV